MKPDRTPGQLIQIICDGSQYTAQEKEIARLASDLISRNLGVTIEQWEVLDKIVRRPKPVIEWWELEQWTVDTWNS